LWPLWDVPLCCVISVNLLLAGKSLLPPTLQFSS
jgi:hypothetical protein